MDDITNTTYLTVQAANLYTYIHTSTLGSDRHSSTPQTFRCHQNKTYLCLYITVTTSRNWPHPSPSYQGSLVLPHPCWRSIYGNDRMQNETIYGMVWIGLVCCGNTESSKDCLNDANPSSTNSAHFPQLHIQYLNSNIIMVVLIHKSMSKLV